MSTYSTAHLVPGSSSPEHALQLSPLKFLRHLAVFASGEQLL